ncbi:MAG: Cell division protein FtsH [Armatimonadetes bacterium]|jgi:AAA+ superfamily predicted ATPase|nr:Cell division protein FtsH [Armatimonadota bacterium]
MSYSTVIAALTAALQVNPDDVTLRLHVAQLLMQEGVPEDSLAHYTLILARDPAHLDALKGASEAAAACGELARADGYRRLHAALSGVSLAPPPPPMGLAPTPPAPQPEPLAPPAPPAPEASYDWNELLRHNPDDEPDGAPDVPDEREDREERIPVRSQVGPQDEDFEFEIERSDTTLADVAGMEAVKRRLEMAFLAPLRNPELMRMYGKSLRGGLILYGPPGCGKTFIARALAGELGAKFIAVGMADVLDMWLGESEKKLQRIFDTARRNAPAVLFFDEVDALGQKRSHMRHSAGRSVVNQLLAEMDSIGSNNDGVFVLGATNHPWDVDTALRRPGRFDRMMLVLPPDEPARMAALQYHLRNRPAGTVDLRWVATRTTEYSGADLAHLCESAAELAMEEAIRTGKPRPMQTEHFKRAMKEVRPSTRPWFEIARNYAMFANEGGVYDDLLEYIKANRI